jgi:hypothetical protein
MQNGAGEPRRKPTFGERWWPPVDTLRSARKATMNGVYAVIIIVVLTSLLLFLAPEYFGGRDFFWVVVGQLGIFAVIGFFIWCNSRVAAILGMALFIADKIAQIGQVQFNPGNIIVMIALGLMFLHAIRGTFAHHRLKAAAGAAY